MSAVAVRRATPDDAESVLELALGLARSHGDPDDLLTREFVHSRMLDPAADMTTLVACVGGQAVGYVGLLPAIETAHAAAGFYISDLFVAEPYRNSGIGRRLMSAAAAHARARGGNYVWLTTVSDNHDADRFYRRIADIREPVVAFAVTATAFEDLADLDEDEHG